jgi:hypothetical protein
MAYLLDANVFIQAKKIKIPNVCIGLGIKCLTPLEMLRRERARFVLKDRE